MVAVGKSPNKPARKPRSTGRKASGYEAIIAKAVGELRASPVLSAPIRKWLADALDETANSRVRLVVKRSSAGQPKGNLGRTFDVVRMEAAEYMAALIRFRGRDVDPERGFGYDAAIKKAMAWAEKAPRNHPVSREALAKEYRFSWKDSVIPPRSCEYFEGTETNEQAAAYQATYEKIVEEIERSRDPEEIEEEQKYLANLAAEEIARRIGVKLAPLISTKASALLAGKAADGLEKYFPPQLVPERAEALSEQLIQGFLEELARCLTEDTRQRLGEEGVRRSSPN